MQTYDDSEIVNIGLGQAFSIKELALLIMRVVGYDSKLRFDSSEPDGTPRKLQDVTKLEKLGWKAKIPLAEGIRSAVEWYAAEREVAPTA